MAAEHPSPSPTLVSVPFQQAVELEEQRNSEDLHNSEDTLPGLEKGPSDEPQASPGKKSYLVDFEGPNDPDNPKSWTERRRWAITISMGLLVFTVTFASSIFSVNIGYVQQRFNVHLVTATLGVALFVLVGHCRLCYDSSWHADYVRAGLRFRSYCFRSHVRSPRS